MNEIDRHKLVREEFRPLLTSQDGLASESIDAIVKTDGVVALSAAPTKTDDGKLIEDSPENRARIETSIDLIREITARRLNKDLVDLTNEYISQNSPALILDGETEQLEAMHKIATEYGFTGKIIDLDCGKRGKANTKTQFEVLNIDPRIQGMNHLTFVSSDYHIPRVSRTAAAQLSTKIFYDVVAVPHARFNDYDVFKTVRGEINRIKRYAETGDISTTPKRIP